MYVYVYLVLEWDFVSHATIVYTTVFINIGDPESFFPLQLMILYVPHKLMRPSQNSGHSFQTLSPLLEKGHKRVWPARQVKVL